MNQTNPDGTETYPEGTPELSDLEPLPGDFPPRDHDTLVAKLARIAGEMDYVQKTGRNQAQNYSFAKEGDFKAKAKPLLAREEIHMGCTVDLQGVPIHIGDSKAGTPQWLTTVELTATFRYRSAEISCSAIGQGVDPGDKGVYKAMTGALKYIFATSFQVETGDDPENANDVDGGMAPKAPQAPASAPQQPQATPRPAAPHAASQGAPGGGFPPFSNEQWLTELNAQQIRLGLDTLLRVAEKFECPGGPALMPADKQRRYIGYLKKIEPKG